MNGNYWIKLCQGLVKSAYIVVFYAEIFNFIHDTAYQHQS